MPMTSADLRDLVRAAERVASDAGLDELADNLRNCRAARDHPGVRVAVVGDVNRGKSTLVNRLIGTDVLPTGSVPLTRAFVVVRRLAAGEPALEIRWPSGATERRVLAAGNPWHGLVPGRSSGAPVGEDEIQAVATDPELVLLTPSAWLADAGIELIDTPGLHEGRVDHLRQTQRAVAVSDVVVMAISAPSPLSLLERQFLEDELLTKRIPHVIVVLTRVDQLPADEATDFIAWFRAQVAAESHRITVAVGPGLAPAGTQALAQLRERISELAHSGDLIRLRDRRLAWHLADACTVIKSAAKSAGVQLTADEASRQEAVQAAKQQLSEDDLEWNRLRLGLDERRLKLTATIRELVKTASAELAETLDVELHRVGDVKAWWERELPVRLRRDLRNLQRTLEAQVSARVSSDLGWLDSQLARAAFTARRSPGLPALPPVTPAEPQDLELGDLRRQRMTARVVTAGGGIAGAAIAFISGVGIPAAFTMGGSAIAAIIAEQGAEARLGEQRAKARHHARLLLDDVAGQLSESLLTGADNCYQAAFGELRSAQAVARDTRFEDLASAMSTGRDITAWLGIQRQANDIAAEVPPDLLGRPDAGQAPACDGDGLAADDQQGDRDLDRR
jgi:GTPase SAR1 family protein